MMPRLGATDPNPRGYLRNADVLDRLMFRTAATDDGCWTWRGARDRHGYGSIGLGGDKGPVRSVHRVAYEQLVGPIPAGMTLDHLCRNTSCVNPDHLEPVTLTVNIARGWDYRRALGLCRNGHELTADNPGGGKTGCRICDRARKRAYKLRQKENAR